MVHPEVADVGVRHPESKRWFVLACGAFSALLAMAVLAGWSTGTELLKSLFPGLPHMRPVTAVSCLLTAIALVTAGLTDLRARLVSTAAAAVVVVIAAQTLLQYLLGVSFGTDRWLFPNAIQSASYEFPGRMSALAALCFLLLAASILMVRSARRPVALAGIAAATTALLLVSLPLLGYAFGAETLRGAGVFHRIALNTAFAVIVLCTGVLALRRDVGWVSTFSGDSPTAASARAMVVVLVLVPLAFSWVALAWLKEDRVSHELSLAVLALGMIVSLVALELLGLRRLRRLQAAQEQTQRALRASEQHFRALVSQTTAGIVETTTRGTFSFVNARFAEMLGYTPDELKARSFPDITYPADLQRSFEAFGPVASGQRDQAVLEKRYVRQDGTTLWARTSLAPVRDASGAVVSVVVVIVDISDRIAIEEELRQNAELLAQTHDAVIVWNIDGDIRYWNRGAEKLYGFPEGEALGRNIHELLRTRRPLPYERLHTLLLARGEWEGELQHTHRDGRRVIVESRRRLYERGGSMRVMEVNRDVSARILAERALRESEETLRLATDAAAIGVWSWDPASDLVHLSPECLVQLGMSQPPAHGSEAMQALHPEDRDRMRATVDGAARSGEPFTAEYRVLHPDGAMRWITCIGRVAGAGGGSNRMVGVTLDVTEERLARAALRESEERFRQLADAMPQIVFTARGDGYTDYFNRRWYELTRIPEGATADDVWTQTLHPDDRERCLETWYECVRTGKPYQIEYRFRFPAVDEYRWHLGRALPVRNERGEIVRWFGTCTDIHDLRAAQEALRDADHRKNEFLAMLGHELRNPLAPIRNAAQVLKRAGGADPNVQRASEIIDRQVRHMVHLVDDLLDVSRITLGRITLRRERVSLGAIIASAVEASRPLIEAAHHELNMTLPRDPIYVDADATRMSQVVLNLLNNAAKYTPAGGQISLTASRRGNEAIICVRDSGIGIAREKLSELFGMFRQLHGGDGSREGGLGIGLALAKALVEAHQGRIEARSGGTGKGSEFVVILPACRDDEAVSAESDAADEVAGGRRVRVLVVDDNVDAAVSMSMHLDFLGYDTRVCHDGRSAIEDAEQFRPDVVVLDIGLPGLNGYEVARELRRSARGSELTLVALTGWGQESDKRNAREAGFDHHLTKPVDPSLIEKLLAESSTRAFDRPLH